MTLEHKLSREVHQPLEQNGVADIHNHLENGIKKNGYVNGETKDLKHFHMNGDITQVEEIM